MAIGYKVGRSLSGQRGAVRAAKWREVGPAAASSDNDAGLLSEHGVHASNPCLKRQVGVVSEEEGCYHLRS